MASTPPTPSPWQGSLHLSYTHQAGKTDLAYAEAQAPFKMQRSFYPEGEAVCHNVILHTAGGVVGGDRLAIQLNLAPSSQALITTAAASKIYRTNGLTAQQTVRANVAEKAVLEWLPQEAIAFQGADYRQEIQIELAPQAQLILWDIMRLGRSASGEQFLQGNVRSRTEVWQQGRPLWIDRQQLQGNVHFWHAPNALGGCPVLGSLVYLGDIVPTSVIQDLRALECLQSAPHAWGITRLSQGLLCRYRGSSSVEARAGFTAIWDALRLCVLQRSACRPRVWPQEPMLATSG